MDGIVIAENVSVRLVDGQNPKHMVAFKGEDEVFRATVLEVEWNISKHGTLRPLVHVEPVKIGRATISKATGNNARMVVNFKIGPGAVVEIVRSNEVIPKIIKVLIPAAKPDTPKCDYEWAKTKCTKLASSTTGKAWKAEEEEMKKLGATLEPASGSSGKKGAEQYWVWYKASDVHFAPKNLTGNKDLQLQNH